MIELTSSASLKEWRVNLVRVLLLSFLWQASAGAQSNVSSAVQRQLRSNTGSSEPTWAICDQEWKRPYYLSRPGTGVRRR